MGLSVSRSLVMNVVHALGYSFKRVKKRGRPRDVAGHVTAISTFLHQYAAQRAHGVPIVSIDESGFDHRARPYYGFAPRGQSAVVYYKACSDRTRHNLLMAVANTGQRCHVVRTGSVNSVTFSEFVDSMPFPAGSVLLMDNAAIHKPQIVKSVLARRGYIAMFLPSYSPQFQPVELVFGRLKQAYYKERLRSPFDTGITPCIERLVASACTPDFIQRCFAHVDDVVMAAALTS